MTGIEPEQWARIVGPRNQIRRPLTWARRGRYRRAVRRVLSCEQCGGRGYCDWTVGHVLAPDGVVTEDEYTLRMACMCCHGGAP